MRGIDIRAQEERQKDRLSGAYWVYTSDGPKRRYVQGKTRAEVNQKLTKAMVSAPPVKQCVLTVVTPLIERTVGPLEKPDLLAATSLLVPHSASREPGLRGVLHRHTSSKLKRAEASTQVLQCCLRKLRVTALHPHTFLNLHTAVGYTSTPCRVRTFLK
jgi:hypothetical protein